MSGKYTSLNDARLVELMRNGKKDSEGAFKELYNRYSPVVNAYCMRVFSNKEQAEDIFQETFIRFFEKAKADYDNMNVPGFLIRIARNLCLNIKRNDKPSVPIEEVEYLFKVSPHNYEKKELLDLIHRSLDLLDFDYREAFVLREYDGLSYDEIAEICEITVANAKSRVFRAKQKIKTILQPYMQDL